MTWCSLFSFAAVQARAHKKDGLDGTSLIDREPRAGTFEAFIDLGEIFQAFILKPCSQSSNSALRIHGYAASPRYPATEHSIEFHPRISRQLQTWSRYWGRYRDRYPDLNVRHFHEKLSEEHQIELSYSWVKQALQGAGLQRERR